MMMKALFIVLFSSAKAFRTPSSTLMPTKFLASFNGKDAVGSLPPLGYWDPLGLIENGPYGTPEENFFHYRSVELKHGRIAGVAIVGLLTAETTRFTGELSPSEHLKFSDLPNGLAGLKAMPLAGLAQLAIFVGFHELFLCRQKEGGVPGDFGLGYFGVTMKDEAKKKRKLNIEIQNGRLAMLGILGAMAGEQVNGKILSELPHF